jgi:hypothetical protein
MAHTENKARWNTLAQFTKTELDAVLLAQELSKYDVYKPLINAIPLRVCHFDALMCAVDCALSYKCAKQKKISPEMAWNHSVEMLGDIRCVAPMLRCVRAVFAAA